MKFEHKYPDSTATDRFEFEYSFVTKSPKLDRCRWCNSHTKWFDVLFQVHACSEECNSAMWKQYRSDQKTKSAYDNFENHFTKIKDELKIAELTRHVTKDIIIVVHDQLDYLKVCIDSVKKHTQNYNLYIWDNASSEATRNYLMSLLTEKNVTIRRTENNLGFIYPNNELAQWGDSEYIILLNSDVKVFDKWDTVMTGFLEAHENVAQVGYWGGFLDHDGRGFGGANGFDVDYIPGWCFCISRNTFETCGLFNKELQFAYCEDADFSLRLKSCGERIYALHLDYVTHFGSQTIKTVADEGNLDVQRTFEQNHRWLRKRWKKYLESGRILSLTPITP